MSNIAEVTGTRIGEPGQFELDARGTKVRTDSRGSDGPAIYAGELLLGSLISCGLSAIEGAAADRGIALEDLRITARSERSEAEPPRYAWFHMDFAFAGVDQATAEELTQVFLSVCPIYGTLAEVSPFTTKVTTGALTA